MNRLNHSNHFNRFNHINSFAAAVLLLLLANHAGSHPLDTLPSDHWYAVANSRLDAIQYPWPSAIAASGARVGPTWFPGIMRNWSGGAYDTKRERLIIWSGGAAVYTLHPETFVWTKVSPAAGNTVIPASAQPNGTYGRFRYSPRYKAFVLANYVEHNVLLYRFGGTASPPPQPPAAPSALKANIP